MRSIWDQLKYFRKDSKVDNWGDPEKINQTLVWKLEQVRTKLGLPLVVTSGYRPQSKGSQHAFGLALDVVAPTYSGSYLDLYFILERFQFKGLGLYRGWHYQGVEVKGFHVDERSLQESQGMTARWLGIKLEKSTQYFPFNLKTMVELGFIQPKDVASEQPIRSA